MAGTPVLGPVALQDFEVPERIAVGGRQQLVVHNLPGGGRVIDAMGPDEAEIKWSGFFSGPDAAERVRMLEQLRRAGNSLSLAWDSWRYTVIIREFTADVSNPWWIPYRIQLCVVPDPGVGSDDDPISAPTSAQADALGYGPNIAQQITAAGAQLTSSDLGQVVAAAGSLAQLVTAQAYGENAL